MLFKKKITWHKLYDSLQAAHLQIKNGSLRKINIGNKTICIAHTEEGLFALDDKCPHNGASLSNGKCTTNNAVVCPVHRYQFDLKTGRAKSGLGDVAITYPIKHTEEGVFVGISERVWNLF